MGARVSESERLVGCCVEESAIEEGLADERERESLPR